MPARASRAGCAESKRASDDRLVRAVGRPEETVTMESIQVGTHSGLQPATVREQHPNYSTVTRSGACWQLSPATFINYCMCHGGVLFFLTILVQIS